MLCLFVADWLVIEFVRDVHPVTFVIVDIRTLLRRLLRRRWSTDGAMDEFMERASDVLRPRVDVGLL